MPLASIAPLSPPGGPREAVVGGCDSAASPQVDLECIGRFPRAPPRATRPRELQAAAGTRQSGHRHRHHARARVWAPGRRSGWAGTGRPRLGAGPARAGARECVWGRQMTRSHAFLNAVRLAGTEQPRQGSSRRGGGETAESPTARDRRRPFPQPRGETPTDTYGTRPSNGGALPWISDERRPWSVLPTGNRRVLRCALYGSL